MKVSVLPKEKVLPFTLSQVVSGWSHAATPCLPEPSSELEEFRVVVSGVFAAGLGPQCAARSAFCLGGWLGAEPQLCCSRTAAAGKGSVVQRTSAAPRLMPGVPPAPRRWRWWEMEVVGDGDVCYPAALLFPAKLISSLALIGRTTTVSALQDSQY